MIIHIIPSLTFGGAERILLELIKNNMHVQHTVISLSKDNPMYSEFKQLNIPIKIFDLNNINVALINLARFLWQFRNIKNEMIIMAWLYHSCALGSFLSLFNRKIKQIWCIHNANLKLGVVSWKVIIASKISLFFSYLTPHKIIYCSKSAATYHHDLGFNSRISRIIYNGIDHNQFVYNAGKRELFRNLENIEKNELTIACAARYDPQKDHNTLFASLEILKNYYLLNFRIILCGIGICCDNQSLINLIKKYKLDKEVIIKDVVKDMSLIYSSSDIFVLSSKSEALPNVLCEAMLSRVLCVSTNVGDIAKIIGNEGWLVEPNNPEELSKALYLANKKRLIDNEANEIRFKARNRIIKEFSFEKMSNQYRHLWSEMLYRL